MAARYFRLRTMKAAWLAASRRTKLLILCGLTAALTLFTKYRIVSYASPENGHVMLDLAGSDWTLVGGKRDNRTTVIEATLPGDVYMELFTKKQIDDPYFADNDVKQRWISKEDWTYTKAFDLESDLLSNDYAVLVLDFVDTLATIEVNGELVQNVSNLFRLHRLQLDPGLLKSHSNELRLAFKSPVVAAKDADIQYKATHGGRGVIPGDGYPPDGWHGESHANYLRLIAASFSWDWGPAFPTMGVYGRMELIGFNSCAFLVASAFTLKVSSTRWIAQVQAHLWCGKAGISGILSAHIPHRESAGTVFKTTVGDNFVGLDLPVENPKLWWPNEYGDQAMYTIDVSVGFGESAHRTISQSKQIGIGFRTVELVEEAPQGNKDFGLTFYFNVNDIPIFLKGSNWIPGDSFQTRLTCDKIDYYFQSMQVAHMNALRVWGGGRYESDCFYELADHYGILLWQDLMFACSLYPGTDEYLANVEEEIKDQVRRLSPHPSILLWSGNNEIDLGLTAWWGTSEDEKKDYVKLFFTMAKRVVNDLDKSRPYIISSPSNGKMTEQTGGISSDPNSLRYGDTHYWTPAKDGWIPLEPLPRCSSEYGVQSLPSMEALMQAMDAKDLSYDSQMMAHRQHQYQSHTSMVASIKAHLRDPVRCNSERPPTACTSLKGDLGVMVYLTQLSQAMIIRTLTETWRRGRSILTANGEGMTMCTLYWQLNDIWQAPTWASIDFIGKWKQLHYAAKRFYAPLIVSPFIENQSQLKIFAVSDLTAATADATLEVEVIEWSQLSPVTRISINFSELPPLASKLIFDKPLAVVAKNLSQDLNSFIINVRLTDSSGKAIAPNSVVFPAGKLNDVDPGRFGRVKIDKVSVYKSSLATKKTVQMFQIHLKADRVAPFVWLNIDGIKGYFLDNGFTMVSQETSVLFHGVEETRLTLDEFTKGLSVSSLIDIYQ